MYRSSPIKQRSFFTRTSSFGCQQQMTLNMWYTATHLFDKVKNVTSMQLSTSLTVGLLYLFRSIAFLVCGLFISKVSIQGVQQFKILNSSFFVVILIFFQPLRCEKGEVWKRYIFQAFRLEKPLNSSLN